MVGRHDVPHGVFIVYAEYIYDSACEKDIYEGKSENKVTYFIATK